MSITITLEATRLKCTECDHIYEEDEPGEARANLEPAYECDSCGEIFSFDDGAGNRCPSCNKFASKCDPDEYLTCTDCGEATQFEEVYVITCVCCDEEHEVYT